MGYAAAKVQVAMAVLLLVAAHYAGGEDVQSGTEFVYAKCSASGIPGGSPFWGNLGTTLHQLVENTAYADFDFKTQNGGSRCPAFGHATCDKESLASPEDCTGCLTYLANRIWAVCNDAMTAEVKLAGCSIRYDQQRF